MPAMTDPLHLDPLVERLAQEAWERANRARGALNGTDAKQQSSILCQFTRELVAIVAEECAAIADKGFRRADSGDEIAETIRARFSPRG